MTRAVMSRKLAMFVSTRLVASPVEAVTSFMAVTNSDTRSISVFSSALIFSCAPLKHFLQHDVGFAQPLEQRGGVGAQHVVRFQHLVDGGGGGLLRLRRSPFARCR